MMPVLAAAREDAAPTASLRDLAVRAAQAARSDAGDLYALWRGLLEGRFRLVECFERDGRRYYVMRDCNGESLPFPPLDPREERIAEILGWGDSEKAAAYALGLTPSAVSALLKTTLAKLGLRSRAELVMLVRSIRRDRAGATTAFRRLPRGCP